MTNAKDYQVGSVLNAVSAQLQKEQTRPPEFYTEQTLMGEMLAAHKFAKSPEDRDMLKEVAGIGTARTRGGIIEAFVKRGFLDRRKKGKAHQILITPMGRSLLASLPEVSKDVAMTAKWERALGMVAAGAITPSQLNEAVDSMLKGLVPRLLKEAVH